jgi:hypothetical protein
MTRPSEIENIHCVDEEADEAISLDRRRSVKGVGVAVLTVQMLPLIACASGNSPTDSSAAADNLIVHSGPVYVPCA